MMDACCAGEGAGDVNAVLHPLQPLTPAEISKAAQIVRADAPYGDMTRFEIIELLEPAKDVVHGFTPGDAIARKARVNVFGTAVEVTRLIVDLDAGTIVSKTPCPGKRPMISLEKFLVIEDIVRAAPEFIAACEKRGITDMSMVCVDPWSAGNFDKPGEEGRYLAHVFCWLRLRENENFYAHPIDGLNAVVDLMEEAVIRVDDYGSVPIPMQESNYEAEFFDSFQPEAKPIDVVQPEGVNFRLEGPKLIWRNWEMVVGFNARESLTLHDIKFNGRPVMHRASLVEMTVPYGTPEAGHYRKHVFDVGEYGIGKLANSLKLGCDCLGVIKYLDVHLNDMNGDPWTIEKAICIHEEDSGLLWKHLDFRTERTELRRGAKLVVSSICTVGNYEYALYWYFFLDGMIEFEVKATGVINTTACEPGKPSKYSREVMPGVVGHIHQHILCARLDMEVDGVGNSVVECNTEAVPIGPENPYGNAFFETETVLSREAESGRRVNQDSHRYWKIINPGKLNATGKPVAYKLDPTSCVTPFVHPDSPSGKRAGFVQNHLWVTAHDPEERFPGGEFMNHSDGRDGLPDWIAQDRPIENSDVVVWHTFGLHHPVRIEDFPVQPVVTAGFKLMPSGFFDRNPAIDLPPAVNTASCPAKA